MKHSLVCLLASASIVASGSVDPDLMPIRICGLGLAGLDEGMQNRLRVKLSLVGSENDLFPGIPPEQKLFVYETNTVDAIALEPENSVLFDIPGSQCSWLGTDSATFWIGGRIPGSSANLVTEVSLDGTLIGRDTIQVRVAPFLVLSNCDVAEKIFVSNVGGQDWDNFVSETEAAVQGVVESMSGNLVPIAFAQDAAEIGWIGVRHERPAVWSLSSQAFRFLLSEQIGWFNVPECPGMGGNIESTPPTQIHPHGRIVVGNNLPNVAKGFLRQQQVQTDNGELIELPVNWLRVGHVDEVMSVLPTANGSFAIAVADLALGISLLSSEEIEVNALYQDTGDESLGEYLQTIRQTLSGYQLDSNQAKIENIQNHLSEIRSILQTELGVSQAQILSFPVLFSIPSTDEGLGSLCHASFPNSVNCVPLINENGIRRILIPHPLFDSFQDSIAQKLTSLGYSETEIRFILTEGPHSAMGELHCASAVLRKRIQ